MNADSADAIHAAARLEDPVESTRRLKEIVAGALTEADSEARIVSTSNFNHSYLPDFVLEWPRRSSKENRPVYLRSTGITEELVDDISLLFDRHPIFFHLSNLVNLDSSIDKDEIRDSGHGDNRAELENAARSARSLVTSVPALSTFSRTSEDSARLLSSYVVRGGQGLLEEDEAVEAAAKVSAGFEGAFRADRVATADALATVGDLLDAPAAVQFSHLLEAAWISSGASVMEFPGGVSSIGESIPPNLLEELIGVVPADADDFWARLGNSVDLDSLSGLHLVGEQKGLQKLISVALKKLQAKSCIVRGTERIDQIQDPFIWQVDAGLLSLRGGGHNLWVIPTRGLSPEFSDNDRIVPEPSLSKLSQRARLSDVSVVQVEVTDSAHTVTYSSNTNENIASEENLDEIVSALGSSATVRRAVANTTASKDLRLAFDSGAASTKTKSVLPVQELIWNSWALLADSDEVKLDALRSKLSLDVASDTSAQTDAQPSAGPNESSPE
ncbi:hypothetical protein ACYAFX_28635 (plasmid) [Rhodococcus aetherivorans]